LSEDFAKMVRASLLLSLRGLLPPEIERKLIFEALKDLGFVFSREDIERIEEWLKPTPRLVQPSVEEA